MDEGDIMDALREERRKESERNVVYSGKCGRCGHRKLQYWKREVSETGWYDADCGTRIDEHRQCFGQVMMCFEDDLEYLEQIIEEEKMEAML